MNKIWPEPQILHEGFILLGYFWHDSTLEEPDYGNRPVSASEQLTSWAEFCANNTIVQLYDVSLTSITDAHKVGLRSPMDLNYPAITHAVPVAAFSYRTRHRTGTLRAFAVFRLMTPTELLLGEPPGELK